MIPEDRETTIKKAEYAGDYKLTLLFSDNEKQCVDFYPFLSSSLNPLIRKYLEIEQFSKFNVDNGDLEWNDYDLCFPVADLYENRIMH